MMNQIHTEKDMNDITEIIESIKDIISLDVVNKNKKLKDRDVALALNVEPANLASAKFRGRILFKEIAEFCASRNICINTLLYGQSTESLQAKTDKYLFYKYCIVA